MRIAILAKQIPAFESMELGPDGRLVREKVALEMNAYCRRAVSQGVLLAGATGGTSTVFTLGPPNAVDVVREAIGWGATDGVVITDPAFAGSDTLATVKALGAALQRCGPFDLVLVGRNSLDADTGQVGPGLAEYLGWDFLPAVKVLTVSDWTIEARCEDDDGESDRGAALPLVVATAERLIEPCKVPADKWPPADDPRITTLDAVALGAGPWGVAASPTTVGEVRVHAVERDRIVVDGDPSAAVSQALEALGRRGSFDSTAHAHTLPAHVGPTRSGTGRTIGVLLEPDRPTVARELLGEANRLAQLIDGDTLAITVSAENVDELASWGADRVVSLIGSDRAARDIAQGVADISQVSSLWSIVAPSTSWGREVSARVAVLLSTGLTGDAIELDIESAEATPRLVAWKGTLGGHFLVAIRCTTLPQMATVRPGVLPLRPPRQATQVEVSEHKLSSISSVVTHSIERNDDVEELERASRVVAVGAGVSPDAYDAIHAFAAAIDATLAATRKVTDRGWMPHARQVGITGRTIRPDLYVAIGLSGKFNHIVGAQSSGTVLAINDDPNAPIFASCDVGIVGDWAEVLPLLQVGLGAALKEAR